MAPHLSAIHEHLTEAIHRLEKARDLISLHTDYPCQSVDVNAIDAACRMLTSFMDIARDVDRSVMERAASRA